MTDEPKKRRVNYDTPGTEEYSRMQTAVRQVWRAGSNVNMTEVARTNGVKLQINGMVHIRDNSVYSLKFGCLMMS